MSSGSAVFLSVTQLSRLHCGGFTAQKFPFYLLAALVVAVVSKKAFKKTPTVTTPLTKLACRCRGGKLADDSVWSHSSGETMGSKTFAFHTHFASHGKWLVCRHNVLDVDDEVVWHHVSVIATALLESVPFMPPPTELLLYDVLDEASRLLRPKIICWMANCLKMFTF